MKSENIAKSPCIVITVVYNSQKHLEKWFQAIHLQTTIPKQVILVDTGSKDKSYLDPYRKFVTVVEAPAESGFCKGNNIGWQEIDPEIKYVLFLNPDAFLSPSFIDDAIAIMEEPANSKYGALTGLLHGYDIGSDMPTGLYDSTGIFRTSWGHWYDRDQGKGIETAALKNREAIPAICGACIFARRSALESVLIRGEEVFDNSFYMYKEDIDLSLRLRNRGWTLQLEPDLKAYHCRGWQADRQKMPKKMRLSSAKNELTLHVRQREAIPTLYSACKYLAVKYLNM